MVSWHQIAESLSLKSSDYHISQSNFNAMPDDVQSALRQMEHGKLVIWSDEDWAERDRLLMEVAEFARKKQCQDKK